MRCPRSIRTNPSGILQKHARAGKQCCVMSSTAAARYCFRHGVREICSSRHHVKRNLEGTKKFIRQAYLLAGGRAGQARPFGVKGI